MTTNTELLLPCPFCGSQAKMIRTKGESLWSHDQVEWTQVQCTNDDCGIETDNRCEGWEPTPAETWNARAALTPPAQAGEAVAYLHDDGFWTAAKTDAGRQLNDRLLFAGSPKIGVYTAPPASQEPCRHPKRSVAEWKEIAELEDQAGGVFAAGALVGQEQAHDMAGMLERGAKAWAGVDPQELRAGGQEQAQQPSMICKTCGADRFKEPCKNSTTCTMVGESQAQQPSTLPGCDECHITHDLGACAEVSNKQVFAESLRRVESWDALPFTDDIVQAIRESGMTFHLGIPHTVVVEQLARFADLIKAQATIKAATAFATPKPEPMTDEQAYDLFGVHYQMGIIRAVEAHYGITKEQA